MKYERIYRVEHRNNGLGPYAGLRAMLHLDNGEDYYCPVRRPSPDYDGLESIPLYAGSEWYSGFRSLTQVRQWFQDAEGYLESRNFYLAIYHVLRDDSLVRHGGKQSLFKKTKARKVTAIPLRKICA